jgi:hypothetical protein
VDSQDITVSVDGGTVHGMPTPYDEQGNYEYPEGFDPEAGEWKIFEFKIFVLNGPWRFATPHVRTPLADAWFGCLRPSEARCRPSSVSCTRSSRYRSGVTVYRPRHSCGCLHWPVIG